MAKLFNASLFLPTELHLQQSHIHSSILSLPPLQVNRQSSSSHPPPQPPNPNGDPPPESLLKKELKKKKKQMEKELSQNKRIESRVEMPSHTNPGSSPIPIKSPKPVLEHPQINLSVIEDEFVSQPQETFSGFVKSGDSQGVICEWWDKKKREIRLERRMLANQAHVILHRLTLPILPTPPQNPYHQTLKMNLMMKRIGRVWIVPSPL